MHVGTCWAQSTTSQTARETDTVTLGVLEGRCMRVEDRCMQLVERVWVCRWLKVDQVYAD
jgi:hypothetical protein